MVGRAHQSEIQTGEAVGRRVHGRSLVRVVCGVETVGEWSSNLLLLATSCEALYNPIEPGDLFFQFLNPFF